MYAIKEDNSDEEDIDDLIQRAQIIIEENRGRKKKPSDSMLQEVVLCLASSEVPKPEILPATISATENTPQVTEASLIPPQTTAQTPDLTLRESGSISCISLSPIREVCKNTKTPLVPRPLTAACDDDDVIFVAYEPATTATVDLTSSIIPNKRFRCTNQMVNDVVVIGSPTCATAQSAVTITVTTPIVDSPKPTQASYCPNTPSSEKLTLQCPICIDPCRKPTSTLCGHIFCEQCIKKAVKISRQCPICKRKLTPKSMHPLYL